MSAENDATRGFKSQDDKEEPTANNGEGTPGVALAGSPGTDKDDCKQQYREQRHELFGASAECSPSTGWRGVYAQMEVGVNVERR